MSLQVSTQFCQHWGAVLAPARPARDSGSSGERAGKCEERTVGERYRDPAPRAYNPLPPAAPVGRARTPGPMLRFRPLCLTGPAAQEAEMLPGPAYLGLGTLP